MPGKNKKDDRTSYDVISEARKLVSEKKITNKTIAEKTGCSASTVTTMFKDGYTNKTLSFIDALRTVVDEIKSKKT